MRFRVIEVLALTSVTMKELLDAGVHFGHRVGRWNPKMKDYIFGERNGIYIIDLQKTLRMFRDAIAFVTNAIAADRSKTVLFIGTKRHAQDVVREEAERAGQFYVNQRWLGGLLTNFPTVQKSIERLKDLETMQTDGRYERLTKTERNKLDRERMSLTTNFSGIKAMSRLPDIVFIIDVRKEEIAVAEANRLAIPIVAVVDTNCSPDGIDFMIPGNDDAVRAVRLYASRIADAILEGQQTAADYMSAHEIGEEAKPFRKSSSEYTAKSNAEVRAWYLERISIIRKLNDKWLAEGITARQRAFAAWQIRHTARLEARSMMANPAEVKLLRARDLSLYGSPDGPSFEFLVARLEEAGLRGDELFTAIIEGSSNTNTGINRLLGL